MSEITCGLHCFDQAIHNDCIHCLQARIRHRDKEMERLRSALSQVIDGYTDACVIASEDGKYSKEYGVAILGSDWLRAVRSALGNKTEVQISEEYDKLMPLQTLLQLQSRLADLESENPRLRNAVSDACAALEIFSRYGLPPRSGYGGVEWDRACGLMARVFQVGRAAAVDAK